MTLPSSQALQTIQPVPGARRHVDRFRHSHTHLNMPLPSGVSDEDDPETLSSVYEIAQPTARLNDID